jgi:hypothetical protein
MPTPAPSRGTILRLPKHILERGKTVKANSPKPESVSKSVTAKNVANSTRRFNEILKARPATYRVVKPKGGGKHRFLTRKEKRLIKFQPVLTPITEEHPSEMNRSPIRHRSRKTRSPELPIPPPPSHQPRLKHSSASMGGSRN